MEVRFGTRFLSSIVYLIIRNPTTPSRIFGRYEKRKLLNPVAAQERFQQEWIKGLQNAVISAISREEDMSYEDTKVYLNSFEIKYLEEGKKRRSFKYQQVPFIVQFNEVSPSLFEIDQLWYIHSHDPDNNLVCVSFDTKAELDAFHERARQQGFSSGQEMLEKYVQSFMQNS